MRTNIFRSSERGGNVPRTDPFFHLIRMKMDSLLSGVTAICPIIIDNDQLEQESTHWSHSVLGPGPGRLIGSSIQFGIRVVGKNEKLESFNLESLKLENFAQVGKSQAKLERTDRSWK